MTVLCSFLLCLGAVCGLVVGYALGDYYGSRDGRKEQRERHNRHIHQRN